jgi:tetratricopeptide (TPR) repeat protein
MNESAQATATPSAPQTGPVAEFHALLAQLIEKNEGFRARVTELSETFSSAVTTHMSGDLVEAEAKYRSILTKAPNHPRALQMLGVIELQRGNAQSAIDLIRRAIQVYPGHPEAWINFGNALRAIQKNDEAIIAYGQAIRLKPDMVLAHTELSKLLMDLGRYEAAISYCEAAVAINPGSMPARVQLAIAPRYAGRLKDAARHWSEIIALEPNRAESYYVLGTQLREMGLLPEALHCHNRAVVLKPDIPEILCAKGSTLIYLNQVDEALECFQRAETLSPGMPDALSGVGWSLRSLGRFAEADHYFEKVRARDPTDPRSYKHLSSEDQAADDEEQNLTALVERSDITPDARLTAEFGLGRLLDKAGRYDEAFARYATANARVLELWPNTPLDLFDTDRFIARIEGIIQRYRDRSSIAPTDFSNMSELPVFVVGMPRSGKTLVEQICASHSRVFGAGELGDIIRLEAALNRAEIAGSPEQLCETARSLAKEHIVKLYGQANGALRVVDKMPDNILVVGRIARLFLLAGPTAAVSELRGEVAELRKPPGSPVRGVEQA